MAPAYLPITMPAARLDIPKMLRNAFILLALLILLPLAASRLVPPRWIPLVSLVLVGLFARLPAIAGPVSQLLERCRRPSPRGLRWATLAVWGLAVGYLVFTAMHQHRDLFPRLHDEHSYLIQSRMVAAGRLWEPQHPLADFFDNFYMLSRPVYAPIYFPGTALLNAPFVRLRMPYWTMPILVSGLAVALTFYLTTVLIDGIGGLIAAVVALSTWSLREFSTMVMAQAPMMLLGLLIVCVWLIWRRKYRIHWAGVLGVCIGWAAITRPVDALAFTLPVFVAMAFDLKGLSARRRLGTAAVVLVGMAPFFLLQGVFNRGTTGSLWKMPYTLYLQRDQPGSEYGFHAFHAGVQPASVLLQKRDYLDRVRLTEIQQHTFLNLPREIAWRVMVTAISTLPAGILWVILWAVPLGLTDRRRWVFWSVAPLFVALYLPNPFFLVHYPVPLVPVMAFSVALAVAVLARGRRREAPDPHTSTFLTLIVLAACIGSLPEFRRDVRDGTVPAMTITALAHNQLASAVHGPAVVLFRYRTGDNPVEDPAYNDDVTWPDDAPIIRAHDLGARNVEIARYYAAKQPWRTFYLLDRQENAGRQTLVLHPLGSAKDFLHTLELRADASTPSPPARFRPAVEKAQARQP